MTEIVWIKNYVGLLHFIPCVFAIAVVISRQWFRTELGLDDSAEVRRQRKARAILLISMTTACVIYVVGPVFHVTPRMWHFKSDLTMLIAGFAGLWFTDTAMNRTGPVTLMKFCLFIPIVAIDFWMYSLGLMRWPNPAILLFVLYCHSTAALAWARSIPQTKSLASRWKCRTIVWIFVYYSVGAIIHESIWPVMPEPVKAVLVFVSGLSFGAGTWLVFLAMSGPKWWLHVGSRFEAITHSVRYMDSLVGLLGMLHDFQLSHRQPQRQTVATLAENIAYLLRQSDDVLTVSRAVSLAVVVPDGVNADTVIRRLNHNAPPGPNNATLIRDVEHFHAMYRALVALQKDQPIPADAPVSARVVRAAIMHLTGHQATEIAANAGDDVADALMLHETLQMCVSDVEHFHALRPVQLRVQG